MEEFLQETLRALTAKGPIVGICLVALWVVAKRMFKVTDDLINSGLRRVEDMSDSIASLEVRSDECEADRIKIRQEFSELQKTMIEKLLPSE